MNQNKKLQQLRRMVRADFKRLDTALEKMCLRSRCKAEDVANAFLDDLAEAVSLYPLDPANRQFVATTRELRELVPQALMPDIRRRIAAYNKRFPRGAAIFEKCEREALEILRSAVHPADTNILLTAIPGRYEACYWPESDVSVMKVNNDKPLSPFALLWFSPPGT